jgi:hypothetical protein
MKTNMPPGVSKEEWYRRLLQSDRARLRNFQRGREIAAAKPVTGCITSDTREWIIAPLPVP